MAVIWAGRAEVKPRTSCGDFPKDFSQTSLYVNRGRLHGASVRSLSARRLQILPKKKEIFLINSSDIHFSCQEGHDLHTRVRTMYLD